MEGLAILFWSAVLGSALAFMANIPRLAKAFDKKIQKPKKQCITDVVMRGYYGGRLGTWRR